MYRIPSVDHRGATAAWGRRARRLRAVGVAALLLLLAACTGVPEGVQPVRGFELDRYLGTWYEVARLDHGFERGLSRVTANYSMREDGGVHVVNRGWRAEEGEWDQSEGKAYFVDSPDLGRLKVSFFGPFYGAYNIMALDQENYSWSMVAGPDRSYLWILSRSPEMDPEIYAELLDQARAAGFPVDELIRVEHGG
ncbi:MAG: lipocalin family protein [Gammaproteobacteria bacterium]